MGTAKVVPHAVACPARTSTYYACTCANAEIDKIEHAYKTAGGTLPGAPMQHGPAMCFHGYYAKGCPWCNQPDVSEAEKDRRLKAFMPLLHKMVDQGHTPGYAPDEVLVARIERILEVVEHPRRKVTKDGE